MKRIDKKSLIILIVLFVVYFGMSFYYNYKSQMMSEIPEATAKELESCKLEKLENDRIQLTIPATYVYGATQENLDQVAQTAGYESIILNEDGSATYTISKEQHKQMLSDLHTGLNDKLIMLPGSDNFKEIESITSNEDFTDFTVKLTSGGAGFDSSMSAMTLKMYSTMYNAFQGVTNQNVHITYINKSGTTVADFNSKEVK